MSLRDKIISLEEYTKSNDIKNIISRITELFPREEFEYEDINKSMFDFVDRRTIIYLPDTTNSYIQIKYPGGDRFGSNLTEPYTDIMIAYAGKEDKAVYIVREDKYNPNNRIDEHVDQILANDGYTKEAILQKLLNREYYGDLSVLKKLTPEQKQDDEIVSAVKEKIIEEAADRSSDAYDQYWYGHNGGMDVESWEMKTHEQVENILENYFPDSQENRKIYDLLLKDLYKDPEVLKDISNKVNVLEEKLKACESLQDNKTEYLQKFEKISNNYNNAMHEYSDLFDLMMQERQLNPYVLSANILDAIKGNTDNFRYDLKKIINSLSSEIDLKEFTIYEHKSDIQSLEKKNLVFWQSKENKQTIQSLTQKIEQLGREIENCKNDIQWIEKETSSFLSDKVVSDNLPDINVLSEKIYNYENYDCSLDSHYLEVKEGLFFHSDDAVEIQKTRLENAIDQMIKEKPAMIESLTRISDNLSRYAEDTPENEELISKIRNLENADEKSDLINRRGIKDFIKSAKAKAEKDISSENRYLEKKKNAQSLDKS